MASHTITEPLITYIAGDTSIANTVPGGVWLSVAPAEAATPVIVVSLRSAPMDSPTWDGETYAFSYVLYVEAPQNDVATVRTIHDRLYTLLHRVMWTADNWTITRSLCSEVIEEAVIDPAGTRYHRLGYVLSVTAQRT